MSRTISQKISATHTILRTDTFHGFRRTVFDFRGREAWVVEPDGEAARDHPWTWTMQWADSFVPRTGVPKLLGQGWRHVTLHMLDTRADDASLPVFRDFQDYLVGELGFAPKARLVGMSWGGFFSIRYAAHFPQHVKSIYLDAPLMNLDSFAADDLDRLGPWADSIPAEGWSADPRMPVNLAAPIARAGIPILLLYGGVDAVVPPALNCELFAPRFEGLGGAITVENRASYAHHPHGVEVDDRRIANFFLEN